MTDFSITPPPFDPGTPDLFPETLAMQNPVDGKFYTQYGGTLFLATSGQQKGGVTRVRFSDDCEITEIGVLLSFTFTGSDHNYRLGIYSNQQGEPGNVDVDAGTLNISNPTSSGMKSIVLSTPYQVSAGQVVWLACQCDYSFNFPALAIHAHSILAPYVHYGLTGTTFFNSTATAFSLIGDGANALPDPFTLGTPEVHGHTPAVYVKVSV